MANVYVLTTGGTIEKAYSERTGTVQNLGSKIDLYLGLLRSSIPTEWPGRRGFPSADQRLRNVRPEKIFVLLLLICAGCASTSSSQTAQPPPFADTIYFHGNILTGENLGSRHPLRVSALAIRQGMIAATGTEAEILKRWQGPKTELVDLRENFVLPGFNDAHLHLASGGFEKLNVDLIGVKALEEMKERIGAHVRIATPGQWIRGRGWDHQNGKTKPFRHDWTLTPSPTDIQPSLLALTDTSP